MPDIENIIYRTITKPIKFDFQISYESNMMFIGSCFTENIGNILLKSKFNVDINPFGIIYNPGSVLNGLNFIIENKTFKEEDIFYFNERWNSYFHHGRFSHPDKDKTIQSINSKIKESSNFLKNANLLFITFGTSWIYEKKDTNEVVANCHKVPSKKFNKRLLTVEEITQAYSVLLKKLKDYNKDLKIIFTISPVRHIKDGLIENNLSKSVLRLAINNIINEHNNSYYFPAYELLIDDLRDYRFYDTDLLHPNKTAIKYIFNYFGNSFFSEGTYKIYNKIEQITRAIKHRPFNPSSIEYKKFAEKNIQLINTLKAQYKYLNLTDEINFFKNKQ